MKKKREFEEGAQLAARLIHRQLCNQLLQRQDSKAPVNPHNNYEIRTWTDWIGEAMKPLEQARRAADNGWALAANKVVTLMAATELRQAVQCLNRIALQAECFSAYEHQRKYNPPEPLTRPYMQTRQGILDDILYLSKEFDDVEVTGGDNKYNPLAICAVTEPIELSGVDLGRFQISLRLNRDFPHCNCFKIEAVDPVTITKEGYEYDHPHVRDGRLCFGNGEGDVLLRLQEGQVLEAFRIADAVLHTYNGNSPYAAIGYWTGEIDDEPENTCADCGDGVSDDDLCSCHRCDNYYCEECTRECPQCHNSVCADCSRELPNGERACNDCQARCADCRERFINDDLEEGVCATCQQARDEAAEEETQEESDEEHDDESNADDSDVPQLFEQLRGSDEQPLDPACPDNNWSDDATMRARNAARAANPDDPAPPYSPADYGSEDLVAAGMEVAGVAPDAQDLGMVAPGVAEADVLPAPG